MVPVQKLIDTVNLFRITDDYSRLIVRMENNRNGYFEDGSFREYAFKVRMQARTNKKILISWLEKKKVQFSAELGLYRIFTVSSTNIICYIGTSVLINLHILRK